jgi:S1-C subfamily serine protease
MRKTASLAIVVAALAVAGCGGSDETEGAKAAKPPAGPSDARRAIVLVEGVYPATADKPAKTTRVSGVIWEAGQGLVLTANHAIEAAPNVNVTLADGTLVHARALARAQCHDLAVLKLSPRPAGIARMEMGDSDAMAVGEPVTTLTYLLSSAEEDRPAFTRVQGTVSATGVRQTFPPLPPTGPFIAHQTSLIDGAAGSPVVDTQGRMIGLNTLVGHPREPDLPGIEYALTSNYINARLRQLKPGTGGALVGWAAEHNACHQPLRELIGLGHTHDASESGGGSGSGTGSGSGSGSGTGGGSGSGSGDGH